MYLDSSWLTEILYLYINGSAFTALVEKRSDLSDKIALLFSALAGYNLLAQKYDG